MTVAEHIAKLIEAKGWTQEEAALAMGVSRFSINQLLNGRRTLTAWMAVKLETVFGGAHAKTLLMQQVEEDLEEAYDELGGWITRYGKHQGKGRR
jgi:addiction module HigA family antidote